MRFDANLSVGSRYHTEHELLRYIHKLQSKDLSLCHSMIPLGSCTMKLNATTEMMPVTWPAFASLHPFAPREQAEGYQVLPWFKPFLLLDFSNWHKKLIGLAFTLQEMFKNLGEMLCTITGFDSVSLQPNAGAAGEYAGLMVIHAYHLVFQSCLLSILFLTSFLPLFMFPLCNFRTKSLLVVFLKSFSFPRLEIDDDCSWRYHICYVKLQNNKVEKNNISINCIGRCRVLNLINT